MSETQNEIKIQITPTLTTRLVAVQKRSGETVPFDVKKIYHLPCFHPLQNKEFFKTVRIEYGSIAWDNDIDYCPDCLYEESF
jgi:hypothetical protein